MRSAFTRWLCSPAAPLAIVGLALLLLSPALSSGLVADDYFHALVLTGNRTITAISSDPLQLFTWADGDPARAQRMMEVGMTGWWTNPRLVMAYFRPISVATHWLDYRLWPASPWLMHLHSLLWFAAALALLWRLYRSLLAGGGEGSAREGERWPAVAPALALLLYAIDDAHGFTVAWVANRNALVALTLALAAFVLYDRAARGDVRAARVGPLVFAAALLGGESALAITGYFFGYALYIDPAPRARALRRLVPYAVVALLWAALYRALGCGARGSGLVIDPASDPLRFIAAALVRVPVLLAAQLGFPPSDAWEAYSVIAPWLPALMLGLALLLLGLLFVLLRPQLRAHPALRGLALGALLACVPVSAQFPHDRLLLFAGIGCAPLIALLLAPLLAPAIDSALDALATPSRRRRVACYALAALHLGIAPLWLPIRARGPADITRMIDAADRSVDSTPAITDKTVVMLNPPVDAYAGYLPPARAAQGRPRPAAIRWLATGASDVTVTRVDERTLRVRPSAGFLSMPSEHMQRDPSNVMPVGYTIAYSDLTIEVTALTADQRPAEILARFAKPLADPHYVLLAWGHRRFDPFVPPAIGETRVLPKVDFTELLP